MDIVYFTIIAIGIYFAADRILDFIERKRGARFENRQLAFFAIILPLALITFWLVRALQGAGGTVTEGRLINIGFGNTVVSHRVVAVVMPGSAPMKRLREKATQADRLIDATHGRKTRSIIVTDSNHIILSAVHTETLSQRLNGHGVVARADSGEKDT